MKKILPFLTGAVIALSLSYLAKAQTSQAVRAWQNDSKIVFPSSPAIVKESSPGSIYPYKINIKAIREFIRTYKNTSDAKWYILSDGFVVHFYMNNTKYRAFYKRNGNWVHTLSSYGDDQLPPSTRQRVKCVYYDYTILLITEIQLAKKTVYLVKLEDKTLWKTIRVCEGEDMEEIESYFKIL
jgi:peptidoglycan hydrolase-like protein with peptidoglycan-binding domain